MTDGQLLVSIDGLTYTTYMQDLPDQYRVVVGNQTLIFAKENDPTLLAAPSTGKLIKFLVADGSHIDAGQPYCEMEVMKMITSLTANEVRNISVILKLQRILILSLKSFPSDKIAKASPFMRNSVLVISFYLSYVI
jgi:pyruvate carboxylase